MPDDETVVVTDDNDDPGLDSPALGQEDAANPTGAGAAPAPALGQNDDAAAATALIATIKALPGVPKALADLISGTTPAEITASLTTAQAMYTTIRAEVQAEAAAHVPAGRGGKGAAPPPASPFEAIQQGLAQEQRSK